MRGASWPVVVTLLGVVGTAVALLAGSGIAPPAAVVVPLGLVPLAVLGTAFVGLARRSAVRSSALVTVVAIAAPIADLWSRSVVAGNTDDATRLGPTSAIAITGAGLAASVASPTGRARAVAVAPALSGRAWR